MNFFLIFLVVYSVLIPISAYSRAKRMYQLPSSGAKEKAQYEFQENLLVCRSESTFYQTSWKRVFKVTVTKNWVFIWINPVHPVPIPKSAIWEGELLRLREILDANKIKHNFQ